MEQKVFGYGKYDTNGEMILTTYENEFAHMRMDIRLYKMKQGDVRVFESETEEIAVLLLKGEVNVTGTFGEKSASRKSVFLEDPYAAHIASKQSVRVIANSEVELLVQKAINDKTFESVWYTPAHITWKNSYEGKWNNTANRFVNTIIDHDINPQSEMVLGEIRNLPGNWSGYLPHNHPQPECYFFLFDHEEGFGASFVGDDVYKSTNYSFSAIPGGDLHPQVSAPGFQMYTCWMIRHNEGNPWLQTDRCEDDAYVWLHKAKYNEETHAFEKEVEKDVK